ncbi:MAG: hypothetical protein Q7K11_01770 [Candidatus Berkelbacteria bacterium]|nr:hypothetical protein [Candidatus Berkelbacteria bacterium]
MPNHIQPRSFLFQKKLKGWWRGRLFALFEVNGNPHFLNANRNNDGRWLNTNYANPDNKWNDNGAFFWSLP